MPCSTRRVSVPLPRSAPRSPVAWTETLTAPGCRRRSTRRSPRRAARSRGQRRHLEELLEVHPNQLVLSEVFLTGCLAYSGTDHPETIQALASGQIDARALVSARIGLSEAIQGGFEELVHHKDAHTKILIDPRR